MLMTEHSKLPDKKNKKAAFSVAWMKLLGNFIPGKSSQENLIIERFLVGQRLEGELVHAVLSVLHEMVYMEVLVHRRHLHRDSAQSQGKLSIRWYCKAALHRMIRLRAET